MLFILTLPLLVLGLASSELGIRFAMYANSVLTISYLFLLVFIYDLFKHKVHKVFSLFFPVLLTLVLLNLVYKNIIYFNTKVAVPVFVPQQLQILDILKQKSKPEDYIVTWWDYGWPLWYYTGMKTLIDNGKHHQDNYVVSKIFMSDSQAQANHAIHLFYETYNPKGISPAFNKVISKYKDSDKVFEKLKTEDLVKKKKMDKYIFIPFQMLNTLYTIYTFSNLDINTGKQYQKNIYFERTTIKESIKQKINLKVSSYLSIPSKFIYMSILMLGTITGVLLLIITKDLGWFYSQTFVDGFDFDSTKIAFECNYDTKKRLFTIISCDMRFEFINYINTRVNNLRKVSINPFVSLQRAIHFLKRGDDVPYSVFLDICSGVADIKIKENEDIEKHFIRLQGNPNKLENIKDAISHYIDDKKGDLK